jgi:CspA family cold shock protein
MAQGTVKKMIPDKGFGFIRQKEGDKDLFFHCSGLAEVRWEDLKIGDKVEYEVMETDKGPRAVDIKVL